MKPSVQITKRTAKRVFFVAAALAAFAGTATLFWFTSAHPGNPDMLTSRQPEPHRPLQDRRVSTVSASDPETAPFQSLTPPDAPVRAESVQAQGAPQDNGSVLRVPNTAGHHDKPSADEEDAPTGAPLDGVAAANISASPGQDAISEEGDTVAIDKPHQHPLTEPVELHSTDGYACRIEPMPDRPEVALVTLDDNSRFAFSSEVAGRILAAADLDADQKMLAIISYPNLVEASLASAADSEAVADEVTRLESEALEDSPDAPVAPEIMETPELRELAFRVPKPIAEYLETLPHQPTASGGARE